MRSFHRVLASIGGSTISRSLAHTLLATGFALSLPLAAVAAPSTDGLTIRNVRVLDFSGPSPSITPQATVHIEGDRIKAISVGASEPPQSDQTTIDGQGMTLIPGLYDMHVHIWDQAELSAYLAYGITTVRNMSGMPYHLTMQQRLAVGALNGPRLITTGPILNSRGPNTQVNHQIVETAEEAKKAVQGQYRAGYRHLKVYSNLTRPAYEAIRDEGQRLGMTLSGHTPEGKREAGIPYDKPFAIGFEELLDDHFVTIEHMESIVWHGLYDRHDLQAARALAKKIAASKTPVTPTLLAHHNLWLVAQTKGAATTRPGTEMLNPLLQAFEQAHFAQWAKQPVAHVAEADAFLGQATRIFQDEGVLMVAGTDAGIFTNIPGQSLDEEMRLMVKAGLTPFEALKTATYNPALVLHETDSHGSIAAGKIADMVLLPCDPLADIACLNRPQGVMRAGRWFAKPALDALLETARHPDWQRTADNVSKAMEAQGTPLPSSALPKPQQD